MPLDVMNLYVSILTPVMVGMGLFLFYRLFSRYIETGRQQSPSPSISILNSGKSDDQIDRSGYAFIEVSDDKKSIFADAMQGFKDFATLKGYNVDCSIDTSFSGKVGIRFIILDEGVTVSTAKVRDDVRDYLDRLKDADDLSDMPMTADPVEHQRIVAALQSRFSYLRHQAELFSIKNDFYKNLLAEWGQLSRSPIAYAPNLQLTFQNEGGTTMRDNYNAENSANVAQGRNASAYNKGEIRIGATHSERNTQIASLKALEDAVERADLSADVKSKTTRHLQNAREELEESSSPKPDSVEGWLKKAKNTLSGVAAGGELLEKLNDMLNVFGMNSPPASFQNV